MTVTLVCSNDDPALAIRNHLVPLVRRDGTLEVQRDVVRVVALRTGEWLIEHWTPFNDLSTDDASSPGYRRALQGQRTVPELPYGLDVWHFGVRVRSILWADSGVFKVAEFSHGGWEAEALAL